MNHRAVVALAALALIAFASLAFAQHQRPGPPRDPGPPQHVGNLPAQALAQRIHGSSDAVIIFIVRKNGDVDLLSACRPRPCDVRNTDTMVGGPVNRYEFQKFIAKVGEDPCISWRDSSGTLQTRCCD